MAKGMMIYEAEMEVLLSLEEENRSHIITALICDRLVKEVPDLNPMENAVFTLIREQTKRAAKLSDTRSDSVNERWKKREKSIGDETKEEWDNQKNTSDIQACTNDIQNSTNDIQTEFKDDTKPYTNTNTNTNTNTSSKKSTSENIERDMGGETSGALPPDSAPKKENPKPIKKSFGEYRHVKLSEEQHAKLIADFGETLAAEYIRRCDEYVQSKGTKKAYSDYNLALRQWLKRDGHGPRGQPKEKEYDPYSEPIFD